MVQSHDTVKAIWEAIAVFWLVLCGIRARSHPRSLNSDTLSATLASDGNMTVPVCCAYEEQWVVRYHSVSHFELLM